ncbi:MAG: hypothetical protein IKK29_06685, partial [Christensenellaceae bacterium]|nr:hypothetical protein [Christensenellaceae bacterium]
MDNQFNENSEYPETTEQHTAFTVEENDSAPDAKYRSENFRDADYEPVNGPADESCESAEYEQIPKRQRKKKEKTPLTWRRVAPALIGTTVGGFIIGVII